jgi:hypothetical protein
MTKRPIPIHSTLLETGVLDRSSSARSIVNLAFAGTPSSPSAGSFQQRQIQITDTLTKGGAGRVDTDIRAGQPLLCQSGLSGALGPTGREQCGTEANQSDA